MFSNRSHQSSEFPTHGRKYLHPPLLASPVTLLCRGGFQIHSTDTFSSFHPSGLHLHRRDAALPQLGHNRRHFNGKCGGPIYTQGVCGNSASVPKCSEIAVVRFSREVSESSLKYLRRCRAAADRCSFSPNVDSRAGGRRGDTSLTSVQVSETLKALRAPNRTRLAVRRMHRRRLRTESRPQRRCSRRPRGSA